MATGILSVDLDQVGRHGLSLAALALTALLWLLLAADCGWRLLRERSRFVSEAEAPSGLTGVAATAILGVRLSGFGRQTLAAALLASAVALAVMYHRRRRTPDALFLVCVAAQGVAVLSAALAAADHQAWLSRAALGCFPLGLLRYLDALRHFDLRQIRTGAGDQRAARWRSPRWPGPS